MAIQPTGLAALRAKVAAKATGALNAAELAVSKGVDVVEQEVKTIEQIAVTFFAKIHHSRFVHADGTETIFHFGKAVVTNPEHIAELNAICPPLGNNPTIFKEDVVPAPLPVPKPNAVTEADVTKTDATIQQSTTTRVQQQVGTPDASQIDTELLNAAAGQAVFANAQLGDAQPIKPVNPDQVLNPGAAGSVS